ncbi:MAG: phosphohistidine phosphatase SixA [Acidobacteria bacterium]|nr:phosphohistidine phosphatase SixA [Acidobacteriota bacterium]
MQIYLLRHGIAEDARPGRPDAERALTPEGSKRLREILKRARTAEVVPSVIVTSPYVRARQTAEIAADILGYTDPLVPSTALIPMASPVDTWAEVRSLRSVPNLLLVGHEPHMSGMTGFLLGTPELAVDFKKGALVRIDVFEFGARPRGVLKWMMAPKLAL